MTFSHEDANARLLDLVYGEAAPVEREALEAHVAGCARCQAELKALGDTRVQVRVALDDEAPPARAHARILAAAAEAANGAGAGAAATAPAAKGNEPASRAAPIEEQPSLWERLRAKWTFPTLATVGAVAIMIIGAKVFMDPQKTLERGKQGLFPQEEAAPAGTTNAPPSPEAVAPAAPPPATEPVPAEANEAHAARERDNHELSPQARARIEAVRRYAHPRTNVGNLLGERPPFQSDKLGGAPAAQALQGLRSDSFGGAKGGGAVGGRAAGAGAAVPAEKPSKGEAQDDLMEGALSKSSRGYAQPPADWKAAKKPVAAAAPPPPAPVAKKKVVQDDLLDSVSSSRSSAPAAPAPARAPSYNEGAAAPETAAEEDEGPALKHKAAPAPAPQASAVSRSKADAPAAEAKKEKDAPAPWEAPAKRADELYAARRWSEAAAAYNDLLRRFPTAPLAFAWRSRLGTAQREAAPKAPPAAAKPAKAAPAAASPASE
jgi:hypothetical protein